MKRKKTNIWFHGAICSLLIFLAACNVPLASTPPLPEETPTLTPTVHPTPSCPSASSFGYFTEMYPGSFQLKTTSPEFEWRYSFKATYYPGSIEGWADVCVPDSYTLYFSTGPDFTDEFSVQVTEPNLIFNPSYLAIRWVISPPLAPMQVYRWVSTGHYGAIDIASDYIVANKIPQLHDDSFWPPKNTHRNSGVFKTGPICDTTTAGIPALNFPADGETIDSLQPTFLWNVSDCMPPSFNIQIYKILDPLKPEPCHNSNDPVDFAICINQQNPWLDMETYAYNPVHLLDCTSYAWRVRPVIWINEIMQVGEWSELRSFYVDSGACPTPTPTFIPWTPTPTATATLVPQFSCSDYTDHDSCEANSKCDWYIFPVTSFPKPSICVPTP